MYTPIISKNLETIARWRLGNGGPPVQPYLTIPLMVKPVYVGQTSIQMFHAIETIRLEWKLFGWQDPVDMFHSMWVLYVEPSDEHKLKRAVGGVEMLENLFYDSRR